MMCPLIFTDLDGTLLDHKTYSPGPALPLLLRLQRSRAAHIIPTTSKTAAELDDGMADLPFQKAYKILENGSVIHLPTGDAPVMMGQSYRAIRVFLQALPLSLRRGITGFGDMSDEDVTAYTGLEPDAAKRARTREATEPFLWSGSDDDLTELKDLAAAKGLMVQQGGRFFHLTSKVTKRDALDWVSRSLAEKEPGISHPTIALGDGPNDIDMIEAADFGVIIPNPSGVTINSTGQHVRLAPAPGPYGWVAAVTAILTELGVIDLGR